MTAKIITFTQHKGGTGKTTSCISIAGFLAKTGRRVLIVDFDPQGDSTSGLGIDKNSLNYSMSDIILKECGKSYIGLKDIIISTSFQGLSLAPSNINLATVEKDMYNSHNTFTLLQQALDEVKQEYDFILIDTPPNHGLFVLNAVIAADDVILCFDTGVFAVEAVTSLQNIFNEIDRELDIKIKIKLILITRVHNWFASALLGDSSKIVERELKNRFDVKILKIPYSHKIFDSQVEGKPISYYAPTSNAGKAYQKAALEVIENG